MPCMKVAFPCQKCSPLWGPEDLILATFELGLCYGKLEAGILTFIIPAVLLGHLVLLIHEMLPAIFRYC